ncbi:MAG: family 43 glycosylhydrolase [Lachnospiraceae bacterium]|nr:family 43 glycosylhydrolase [Lachnospiraceae bacterium]
MGRKKIMRSRAAVVSMAVMLAATGVSPVGIAAAPQNGETKTFSNPVIYSDVPDIDMIRVGKTYYMVSTTMHLSPGAPIMKSTDMVNWETVNYVYDRLGEKDEMNLRNGKSMYGKGQWAASLAYHNGIYYVGFNSNTTGEAYIFTTDDIENGSWKRHELGTSMHDMAIFFDGDTPYAVYGNSTISYKELNEDLSGIKEGGKSGTLFNGNKSGQGYIVGSEGTHVLKKDGYYYVFNINWPQGGVRQEVCHRSKSFPGNPSDWEDKVILNANFENNGTRAGVAQGGIIDTEDGEWYAYLFQDHGAVGRTPVLTDCKFVDGWPMLGKNGDGKTVELEMEMPIESDGEDSLTKSDEFYNDAEHREFEEGYSEEAPKAADSTEGKKKKPNENRARVELFVNGDASSGDTEGWSIPETERAELDIASVNAMDVPESAEYDEDGNYCIWVKNRQTCAGGACQDVSGKLEKGKEYTLTGRIRYDEGPAEKEFHVEIQNGENYLWREDIVSFRAKRGVWTEFKGKYSVHDKNEDHPFNPERNHIFIETPWTQKPTKENDLMDFYVDDFSFTTESDEIIENGDFEKGLDGWDKYEHEAGTGDVEIEESDDAHSGDKAAKTANRGKTNDGIGYKFEDDFEPGCTYAFRAWVKQDQNESQTINMTLRTGKGENFNTLGSVEAKKGEWTEVTGNYTFKEDDDTSIDTLFFETPWKSAENTTEEDLVDIYVDDVSVIEKAAAPAEVAKGGESDYNGSNLDLAWQWNHNPDNNNWSLTDRNGWLRLTTGRKCDSILEARNTLTQRTFGPTCAGTTKLDISNMKDGDIAGLAAFSYNYSYIAVKKTKDGAKLVMVDASSNDSKKEDSPKEIASADLEGNTVYLKDEYDFAGGDKVSFYYSLDGKEWKKLGDTVKLSYELTHFMGSRFALFNYATKTKGGYVDFDYFRVSDSISGEGSGQSDMSASLTGSESEIMGVINEELEASLKLGKIEKGSHKKLKASIAIPEIMEVTEVEFNDKAIEGTASYKFAKNRLTIEVKGDDIGFEAEDDLFAKIKLRLKGYADKDETVNLVTDYINLDNGKSDIDVSGAKLAVKLKYLDTGAVAKKLGYSNPLVSQELGADPYAIVYNDRVYVYMTADDYQYDANGNLRDNGFEYIKTLRVISSADMVNWTDHGQIKVAGKDGAAKWANNSWAPAIAYKKIDGKDKFFVYFANGGNGIGVIEGDSPIGPWKDPIGKALISYGTPGCEGVVWCFDPAVLVDDDGTGYVYFGGGVPNGGQNNPKTARVVKLGDDMISLDGPAKEIDAPCMFEDSGIFKYKDKYYYNYCSNFTSPHKEGYPGYGTICYMTSDSPMGPFKYEGEMFDNPQKWFGVGGNNHHATFVFRGKSYFIYHAQTVAKEEGKAKGYRSTHIDPIVIDSKGKIKPIKGTYQGVSQLKAVNPYETIEAETIAWNKGIKARNIDDMNMQLEFIDDGDWTSIAGADFGEKGAGKFSALVSSKKGGKIELHLDSPEGSLIGTVEVPETDGYTELETEVSNVKGERNLFLVFKGEGKDLMTLDNYKFIESEEAQEDPETPVTPEDPEKPVTPEEPEKPVTPEEPEKPVTPEEPEKPVTPEEPETPETPDVPETPETPDEPETPVTPDEPETPVTPEKPETPSDNTVSQIDATKPSSEPAAKATAGNGSSSTADQIAAEGDTTTLNSAESGIVTVNAGAKKLILKGDKGSFKLVSGKGVKVTKKGKLIVRKKASKAVIEYTVGGKAVTKTLNVEKPSIAKKLKTSESFAEISLEDTAIKTAVWTTNKQSIAKVSVSPDGKHIRLTSSKKGTVKLIAEINGRKYSCRVNFKK